MREFSVMQRRVSTLLKLIVFLSAIIGTFLSAYAGRNSFMGGNRVFMYFTIQSNIAIAIISAIGCYFMNSKKNISDAWYIVKFVGTIAITLTGAVFAFVLAPTMGNDAWNIQNTLTHFVVPVVAVIDFFVISNTADIQKKNVIYVIIPPILYAIYAGIGYANNWQFAEGINYPYFFLNWGSEAGAFGFSKELPFMGTGWWILFLLIMLIVVGLCYLLIADLIKKITRR